MKRPTATNPTPLQEARNLFWHLYESGCIDENTTTAGLLTLDLGPRRMQRFHKVQQELGAARRSTPPRAA